MRSRILFLALILICAEATLAGPDRPLSASGLVDSVVKVTSEMRDGSATLNGSGLMFRSEGVVYVVTSDHVLYQSNATARHSIWNERFGKPAACTIAHSQFDLGLALLKCDAAPGLATEFGFQHPDGLLGGVVLHSDEPNDPNDSPNFYRNTRRYALSTAGFPSDSQELVIGERGEGNIYRLEDRRVLMGVESMYIVQGAHGEKGMSGGILYEAINRPVMLGLLSHLRSSSSGGDRIYAIPAKTVVQFLFQALQIAKRDLTIPQDNRIGQQPRQQLRNPYDTQIGRFDFTVLEENTADGTHYLALQMRRIGGKAPPWDTNRAPIPPLYHLGRRIDQLLERDPQCEFFLIGFKDFQGPYPTQRISHPVEAYQNLKERKGVPVFTLRCPSSAESLQKLLAMRPRLRAIAAKIPSSVSRIGAWPARFAAILDAAEKQPALSFPAFDFQDRPFDLVEMRSLANTVPDEGVAPTGVYAREHTDWMQLIKLNVAEELFYLMKEADQLLRSQME